MVHRFFWITSIFKTLPRLLTSAQPTHAGRAFGVYYFYYFAPPADLTDNQKHPTIVYGAYATICRPGDEGSSFSKLLQTLATNFPKFQRLG